MLAVHGRVVRRQFSEEYLCGNHFCDVSGKNNSTKRLRRTPGAMPNGVTKAYTQGLRVRFGVLDQCLQRNDHNTCTNSMRPACYSPEPATLRILNLLVVNNCLLLVQALGRDEADAQVVLHLLVPRNVWFEVSGISFSACQGLRAV